MLCTGNITFVWCCGGWRERSKWFSREDKWLYLKLSAADLTAIGRKMSEWVIVAYFKYTNYHQALLEQRLLPSGLYSHWNMHIPQEKRQFYYIARLAFLCIFLLELGFVSSYLLVLGSCISLAIFRKQVQTGIMYVYIFCSLSGFSKKNN